ncbi:unnamed protein product [Bursaphelenchus okinawaensis]|uniref:Calponin-homology (CH) domain-containing protein n=1 Tax=Bursaphelenchus okinawaensis TaxID=465554 RepID=A0A811JQH7_9BILA|nr:unnamed protein product [Bursaphelenchus okinawaensis]CAG9077344.1 unnamed protein product [Bursaphelenchus okinawaensis]
MTSMSPRSDHSQKSSDSRRKIETYVSPEPTTSTPSITELMNKNPTNADYTMEYRYHRKVERRRNIDERRRRVASLPRLNDASTSRNDSYSRYNENGRNEITNRRSSQQQMYSSQQRLNGRPDSVKGLRRTASNMQEADYIYFSPYFNQYTANNIARREDNSVHNGHKVYYSTYTKHARSSSYNQAQNGHSLTGNDGVYLGQNRSGSRVGNRGMQPQEQILHYTSFDGRSGHNRDINNVSYENRNLSSYDNRNLASYDYSTAQNAQNRPYGRSQSSMSNYRRTSSSMSNLRRLKEDNMNQIRSQKDPINNVRPNEDVQVLAEESRRIYRKVQRVKLLKQALEETEAEKLRRIHVENERNLEQLARLKEAEYHKKQRHFSAERRFEAGEKRIELAEKRLDLAENRHELAKNRHELVKNRHYSAENSQNRAEFRRIEKWEKHDRSVYFQNAEARRRTPDANALSAREALLQWARQATQGYPGVHVQNFGSSWRDGLAFNAILHRYRPETVDWKAISDRYVPVRDRLRNAFDVADKDFGVGPLLDPEDVDTDNPDEKSIMTYVSLLYNGLPSLDEIQSTGGVAEDIIGRLDRGILLTNERYDRVLTRIERIEEHYKSMRTEEVSREVNQLVDELENSAQTIKTLFEDVDQLRDLKHEMSEEYYKRVFGLHQRRNAYLDRLADRFPDHYGQYSTSSRVERHDYSSSQNASQQQARDASAQRIYQQQQQQHQQSEKYIQKRKANFDRLNEAIRYVEEKLKELNTMRFAEDLQTLETTFARHQVDNRDIQDYRQTVDECIARQAEIAAEDTHEYCDLLARLESSYQQLRDISAGRMLDLDTLIAFIRAAQAELVWIQERETIEVARDWSSIAALDLPMLQNYYRQLLQEIEIRERIFNDVHNQGAALINQRHPACDVIDVYLRSMQNQWDWLLGLSRALEGHLRDAINVKNFTEEADGLESSMRKHLEHLEKNYNQTDLSIGDAEQYLRELDELGEFVGKYQSLLVSLDERAQSISPLWQRGERINHQIKVTAWCDYVKDGVNIATGDEVTLMDNYDRLNWTIRDVAGREGTVPSVVFRIPPPDNRISDFLIRLRAQFDRLRRLWEQKIRRIRYNMILNTMRTVRNWNLEAFLAIPPEQRDEIIRALNEDAQKLLSELPEDDPMYRRLAEELILTNEHISQLLMEANKPKEPNHSEKFDTAIVDLLNKLDESWRTLNERVRRPVANGINQLYEEVDDHKLFEENLQSLETDVSNVKELFRQIPNPTPSQKANHDHLNNRWEDLWDLSRMRVEFFKVLEQVLQGMDEVYDIVRRHEITLNSFDDLPAALDKLRGCHAQLLELNMVLQQQQNIVDDLNRNVAKLRQHVARTRHDQIHHSDVDRLEDLVQQVTVRWENVQSQVTERLRTAEESQQIMMLYRSQYDEEIQWLDRVERTIEALRNPNDIRPEELQAQLDQLTAEYAQLQEHTTTIENINHEGGKYIRDARTYDMRLSQFHDVIVNHHGMSIITEFRRTEPQPTSGSIVVTKELEELNRRFAQLSSVILERKNIVNRLIQNWKRKQQEEEDRRRAEEERKRREFEEARHKALDEADRLRREREAAEAARRAKAEEDRRRRELEEIERKRREAEEAARRQREEDDRRRREEEERRRRREEEERRRREEEERLRREEEERRRRRPEPLIRQATGMQQGFQNEDYDTFDSMGKVPDRAQIAEHEDEMERFDEETVVKTQFYEMEGNLHKQTGEVLTVMEQLRQGLLNRQGEFFDIESGRMISLEKAVQKGLIKQDLQTLLQSPLGIRNPETREQLTLQQAIQIGLYDPEMRQFRDIKTQEILNSYDDVCDTATARDLMTKNILRMPPLSVDTALSKHKINPITGDFASKVDKDSAMSLADALANGYLQFPKQGAPGLELSLSDCIKKGFVNYDGTFVDKNNKDQKFTFRDALARGKELINQGLLEVTNTQTNQRITLNEAIRCKAVDHKEGKFQDLKNRSHLTLNQAYERGFISKPMTLTEAVEENTLDLSGRFYEKGTTNRYTLIEAVSHGLLDGHVRHIVDKNEKDVVSIIEALERGLLLANGRIVLELTPDGKPHNPIDLFEAKHTGILVKRQRHTIFDVKGIRIGDKMLSYNEAAKDGDLDENAGTINHLSLQSAKDRGVLDELLFNILTEKIGIMEHGRELSLIEAVNARIVDPYKGVFFDGTREMSAKEAYDASFITLKGALRLAGLLDVHPSLIVSQKKLDRKKRIARPGQTFGEDSMRVTVQEAMKQGLIDGSTQRFRQGNIDLSLQEALDRGHVKLDDEWIVPKRHSAAGPTIEEKTTESVTETGQQLAPKVYPDKQLEESVHTVKRVKRTETSAVGGPGGVSVYRAIAGDKDAVEVPTDGYHILEAERKDIVDLRTGVVRVGGKVLNIKEAFDLGILNPKSIYIKDTHTGRQLDATEALNVDLMDKHGFINHYGSLISLREAIDNRSARVEAEPPAVLREQNNKVVQFDRNSGQILSFRPIGQPQVEEHVTSWTFDSATGKMTDESTGESLSLDNVILNGVVDTDDWYVVDTLTGKQMSFEEGKQHGIIVIRGNEHYFFDRDNNTRHSFAEAAQQHRIYPTGGVPENAGDAVHTTVKIQTRSVVQQKEAVTEKPGQGYNLHRFIESGLYDHKTGEFKHPDTGNAHTIRSLVMKGFIDPVHTKVHDRRRNEYISIIDAIEKKIVDVSEGRVEDTATGRRLDFAEALREGLIRENALPAAIEGPSGKLNLETGEYRSRSAAKSTSPVRSIGSLSPRLQERKLKLTPFSQEPQPRTESPQRQSSSFVRSQISTIERSNENALVPAGNENTRMVDLGGGKNVMVNVIKDQETGIEKGQYFDPASGMKFTIQLHGDPHVTQTTTNVRSSSKVQSVELVPHAEFVGIDLIRDNRTGKVMKLEDAQRQGLAKVHKTSKENTKTYSAFRSNIEVAVNKGILNKWADKVSVEEAIKEGLLDITNLAYIHPHTHEHIPIARAANMGLVDVTLADTLPKGVLNPINGGNISVKEAVDLGIICPRTGEVRNPQRQERLTWLDITKQVYAAISSQGVYDPTKGYSVPICSALNDGLIDVATQKYRNPISEESYLLEEAHQKGLLDADSLKILTKPFLQDYRTYRQLNLVQAVDAGLIDTKNRTVQTGAEKIQPFRTAIQEGIIPYDVAEALKKVDKLTFAEAVGKGLIDVAKNTFTDPDSGKILSIQEAAGAGLVEVSDYGTENETNLANVIQSHTFDSSSGRVRDPKSGLNVPFRDAIDRRLIDPDSLVHDLDSSKTLTVREAIYAGILDSNGRYHDKKHNSYHSIVDAEKQGLIALIASPMEAARAVAEAIKRRDSEGVRYKFGSLDDTSLHRQSLPRVKEEQTIFRITPKRTEPGLSVRVRSNVSDDHRSSRGRSLVEDPVALADMQDEFLDKLKSQGFDVESRVVENPSTMQNVSLREAVETGLFDVPAQSIVHPTTGRHYPLAKAVHMRMIRDEAGKNLLSALNIAHDDLGQMSLGMLSMASHFGAHSPAPIGDDPILAQAGRNGNYSEQTFNDNNGTTTKRTETYTSPDGHTKTTTYTESTRRHYE